MVLVGVHAGTSEASSGSTDELDKAAIPLQDYFSNLASC